MPSSASEAITFAPSVQVPIAGDPRVAGSVSAPMGALNQRIRYVLMLAESVFGAIAPVGGVPSPILSVDFVTGQFNLPGHGITANQPIRFFVGASGGTLPSAVTNGVVYYAIVVDANNILVSATSGGGALVTGGGGFTGEVYIVVVTNPEVYIPAIGAFHGERLTAALMQCAVLSAPNVWSMVQTFSAALVANGLVVANNGVVIQGTLIQGPTTANNIIGGNLLLGGIFNPRVATAPLSKPITATATSFTVDASAPVWFLDTPFPGSIPSNTLTITVDSTSLVPTVDQEIEIIVENLFTHLAQVLVQRAGPSFIIQFSFPDKSASCRLKFIGGVWRVAGTPTGASTVLGLS